MKQIIQMEENKVKNPNWWKANQLGILQTWPNISTWECWKQIKEAVRARLILGTSGLQVQHSNHSVTVSPPNCLPQITEQVRLERFHSNESKY